MTLRHLGGEMAGWSDAAPAGGPAYGYLLRAVEALIPAGGRVLVAGPHEMSVVDVLRAYGEVTCLIRSEPEATALSAAGFDVLCGTLAKLPENEQYDLVVALDGVGRLCSVEGPQYDWAEGVRVLSRSLRPGGALLLAVENELGVHRLVDRVTATAAHTDADWRPVGEYDETKPGTPDRLRSALTGEGLTLGWSGTAWPLPSAPALVVDEQRLRYGPAGALAAAAASVTAEAYAARPVLSDPRRLTATAIRGGLGPELAPAWLVLAFRGPAGPLSLPPAILGDGPLPPLPDGRLLEELLIGACLRHDLPELRRLLATWASFGGTADSVIVDGDRLTALADSHVAPTEAIQRFAETLLAGGYDQPWPHAGDVPSLTAVLLAAAGLTPDPVPPTASVVPDSLREHEERVRRLEEQLADAHIRIRHVEDELKKRDGELRKARLQIDMFSGKVGYRISRFGMRAARAARRRLRTEK
ncbi:hypothetical protein [Actinoplanes sp. N902-109]|uniref:hypothetical protein n=1 Tax=Actinoplanes sp. (strain N902-109) TaxID=649831 RepID=UPI0003295831|nr:hypothetical protein [Actinoplanes sp. N902-109]AGL14125.1 hypothetical protein L083_0615 [Actinoplanes sp. N902-109]